MAALADSAYLIRNKYSCHIPGAGWCQVFDCYATLHVRERPGLGHILRPCFSKFKIILNEFFLPSPRAPPPALFHFVMCVTACLLSLSSRRRDNFSSQCHQITFDFRSRNTKSATTFQVFPLIFFISIPESFHLENQYPKYLLFPRSTLLAIVDT